MSSRLTITNLIEEIAADHNKTLKPLSDDLVLLESGLDSLCFAILVARLEDKLNGHEPWAYLKDILSRLPTQLNNRIEELLPHRWQPAD